MITSKTKNKSLFYPCSGNDIENPVRLFSDTIKDFWFVQDKKL